MGAKQSAHPKQRLALLRNGLAMRQDERVAHTI
jgi:hypothetical protein